MPHSLLVFTRAHDYTSEMFEISDDEYDFEILRRVSVIEGFYLPDLAGFFEGGNRSESRLRLQLRDRI